MRVAYLHVLPLEYYPPATNLLDLLAAKTDWETRAWTTANQRGMAQWDRPDITVSRLPHPTSGNSLLARMPGYLRWHVGAAAEIARWKPDALMSVEPHSSLAAWCYYRMFRGAAPLFIHHHEYYSPKDFLEPGMRVLRATMKLERGDLFPRAEWVSQTNDDRLGLLLEWNPTIRSGAAKVFPNYPPAAWVRLAGESVAPARSTKTRMIYLGSASFEDTFIREVCLWVAQHPDTMSLHVCGNNVDPSVWSWLEATAAPNITTNSAGVAYENLPALLRQFDVGLVLYKGNTLNFVHNVPNKAIEYLACGLEVWYPPQMEAMRNFHRQNSGRRLRLVDFENLPPAIAVSTRDAEQLAEFPFTSEAAAAPLLSAFESISAVKAR